jgi:hypothetical protein
MVNCEASTPMKEKKKGGLSVAQHLGKCAFVASKELAQILLLQINWVLETDTFSEEGTKKKSLGNNILFYFFGCKNQSTNIVVSVLGPFEEEEEFKR